LANQLTKRLYNLNTLKLKFGSPWITDKGLIKFGQSLFNNLNEVKHLELTFWHCRGLTDEGIQDFADLIKSINNLDHLLIDLFECQSLSIQAKKTLERSMEHIPKSLFRS